MYSMCQEKKNLIIIIIVIDLLMVAQHFLKFKSIKNLAHILNYYYLLLLL